VNLHHLLRLIPSMKVEDLGDQIRLVDSRTGREIVLKSERMGWVKKLDGSHTLTTYLNAIIQDEHALPLYEILSFLQLLRQLGFVDGALDGLHVIDQKKSPALTPESSTGELLQTSEIVDQLAKTHFFGEFPRQAIECIVQKSPLSRVSAGSFIVQQDDEAKTFFAVLKGNVSVYVKSPRGVRSRVCVLKEGTVFGENALKPGGRRSADVFAKTEVQLLSIPAPLFQECLDNFVSASDKALLEERIYLSQYLATTPLFSGLPMEALSLFVEAGDVLRPNKDEVIFNQGDSGQDFYLVVRGKIAVLKNNDPAIVLQQGDCFGEIALFIGVPRTATTRCFEDAILMRLAAGDFWDILLSNLGVALMLEDIAEKRFRGEILTLT
jgi:CRP-like cAMP-binding protein